MDNDDANANANRSWYLNTHDRVNKGIKLKL